MMNMERNITNSEEKTNSIAIIGISVKLPGASNVEEYWDILAQGKDCINEMPEKRRKDSDELVANTFIGRQSIDFSYPKGGYLDEIDMFDYKFFHYSPKEARLMDPCQRLFMQSAWEAVEDAGYPMSKLKGSKTSVFLGYNDSMALSYGNFIAENEHSQLVSALTGNLSSIIPSRISNFMDLRGPSMLVNTACSSSLVAVHLACKSIICGESDMAIAGGVQINILPIWQLAKVGIESHDDKTRAFDNFASGTVWSEGVASIVLKPLDDALNDGDFIYACIRGSAVNQDGASAGMTVPNGKAQQDVLVDAWQNSGINPETLAYIEGHGTGTKIGDPIEIEAINKAFGQFTDKKQFCAIGSVKTNIGHTNATSGICGLIKAALSIHYKKLPPTLNFKYPNKYIQFEDSAVYINDTLRFWNKASELRRCGVSSFGFSGTNCHIVLEEKPPIARKTQYVGKTHIFTISAVSESSLKQILCKYQQYLKDKKDSDLGNICYSVNSGRTHFSNRLALVVKNIEDLKQKVDYCVSCGLESLNEVPDIYFGIHKLIPYDKKEKEEYDVYDDEITALTSKALELMNKRIMNRSDTEQGSFFHQLSNLYIKGAVVDWSHIYDGCNFLKVRVPTYALDKKRCWLDFSQERGVENNGKLYHLIDKCIAKTGQYDTYSTMFSPDKQWELKDHIINDRYTVPGTTYLEMIAHVSKNYIGLSKTCLSIQFYTPLSMKDGECKELHLIINKSESPKFTFDIVSFSEGTWIQNAKGSFQAVDLKTPSFSLDDIKQRCTDKILITDDDFQKSSVVKYGERWRNLKEVFTGVGEFLGYFELKDKFINDLTCYTIHPGLMDVAVNFSNMGDLHLPFSYQSLIIYDKMPSRFYSFISDKAGNDLQSQKVKLFDTNGCLFAEVEKYVVKSVSDVKKLAYEPERNKAVDFNISWIEQRPITNAVSLADKTILLLAHEDDFIEKISSGLRKIGATIINVRLSLGDYEFDGDQYFINGSEEHYARLFKSLEGRNIQQIIHAYSIHNIPKTISGFGESLNESIYNLFHMTRSFMHADMKQEVNLVLLSDNAYKVTGSEECIKPHGAALFGLGKVVGKEVKKLKCRGIDIDFNTSIENILAEINGGGDSYLTALREDKRYVEEFLEMPKNNYTIELKYHKDGVYIVTGGTGGIGLEIADHMIKKGARNIVLTSRSAMPNRNLWDEIIHKENDLKTLKIIKKVRDIEANGGNISFVQANVADIDSMSCAFDNVRNQFGKIRGIIHCAGVAGDKMLMNKTDDSFRKVIEPKVNGTWIIDELTKGDSLDFMILFSSISSLIGAPGQGDYTAANAYMDAFAEYRNRKGFRTISINWPAWKETGMAVDFNVDMNEGALSAMSTQQALDTFDRVMTSNASRVIVGELNPRKLDSFVENQFELKVNLPGMNPVKVNENKTSNNKGHQKLTSGRISISGRPQENYSEIETTLAQIWSEVLELDSVDIYESFYLMGGDSIQAIKLVNTINDVFGEVVDVADIFENLTIEKLSAHIQRSLNHNASSNDNIVVVEKSDIDDLLNKLENGELSIDDAEKLL